MQNYIEFLTHCFIYSWIWLQTYPSERVIAFLTLFVFSSSFIFDMRTEFVRNKRKIQFHQAIPRSNGEGMPVYWLDVYVSNTGNRVIKDLSILEVQTLSGVIGTNGLTPLFLGEGNKGHLMASFSKHDLDINDVYSITLIDSVNKEYKKYLYQGKFRNYFLVKFLILWDRLVSLLSKCYC